MAVPEDYIGQRFGAFQIGQIIGAGMAGEVFECRHLINGRRYALKLHVEDDALWDGDPLLPPRNGRRPEVWTAIEKVGFLAMNSPGGFQDFTADYFAVVGNSWVRPLTIAGRVRDAMSHAQLLQYGPDGRLDNALDRSRAFQVLVFAILADAQVLAHDAFDDRWGVICGGDRFAHLAAGAAQAGIISQRAAESVARESEERADLTNNRLFWLLVAADVGDISAQALRATLRCPLFRLNVETVDVAQLVLLKSALDETTLVTAGLATPREAIARAFGWLAELPFNPKDDPEQFTTDNWETPTADSPYSDGVIVMQHLYEEDMFKRRLLGEPS